jgi:hypothetical protein
VLVQEVLLVRIMTRMMILDNTSRSSQTVVVGHIHHLLKSSYRFLSAAVTPLNLSFLARC